MTMILREQHKRRNPSHLFGNLCLLKCWCCIFSLSSLFHPSPSLVVSASSFSIAATTTANSVHASRSMSVVAFATHLRNDNDLRSAQTTRFTKHLVQASVTDRRVLVVSPLRQQLPPDGMDEFSSRCNETDGKVDDVVESDDECVEEYSQQAYGNRSLFWTNKFRKLIPYERARSMAIGLGMASKEEYRFHRKSPYMILNPEEMYHREWVSWDEFLGVMRTYDDARAIVQNVLMLRDMDSYVEFIKGDPKRAEGLRIPARPEIVYRNTGWKGEEDFFGTFQ